ncbi:SBBP repeat-containing protein [Paraliomyxa miuraensis]|uniref:SBBP repeat-containing protein n=1 Tax=Paraliomyxa miuraensis TaxID=376150 RepID=UPI0022543FB4|nr:SBBP repeat-containing protein [Paraliomyxa miuraensis]MCX4240363.1 SBBP repeat-containing protein [Paraliomyxa miuraensis]
MHIRLGLSLALPLALGALPLLGACGSDPPGTETEDGTQGSSADASDTTTVGTTTSTTDTDTTVGTTSTTDPDTTVGTTTSTTDTATTDTETTDTGEACLAAEPSTFVTYLGGDDFEHGRDVAFDCEGNLYVTGGTRSAGFPATLGGAAGNVDVFVTKYDATGTLLWSHRFGGPNYDRAYALELDANGDVVVAGRAGDGLPTTPGALQPSFGGDQDASGLYGPEDGFVAKLTSDGELTWLTYFGGPGRDFIRDVAVDGMGDVYVAASQVTRDHPHVTAGSFDTTRSSMDCVAARISSDGTAVVWGGYLGGTGDDCPEPSIRVDPVEQAPVMIIGTNAADLPDTPGALQAGPGGGYDVFIAKVAADGASLDFGTYFGGSSGDGLETHNLALGPDGRVYLGIVTTSNDLPTTPGAFQPTYGGTGGGSTGQNTNYPGDGFVAVLSADGTTLEHATYLGGMVGDAVEGILVADDGRVYVSGGTFSANFPTAGVPYQATAAGDLDAFVGILAPDLGTLEHATFVGGSNWDVARAVAIGPGGRIAATGETRSGDLNVTPGADDDTFGGGSQFDTIVVQWVP